MAVHPDAIVAALAGVAIGGIAVPLLFPTAAAVKTASLVASIAASGTLAYGCQSGAFDRSRERYQIARESRKEIWIQQQASREALELKRIEVNELVETLVMLDELTPSEQRHFLGELGLLELLPLYQDNRVPVMAESAIETQAVEVKEPQPEFSGTLEWAVQSVVNQAMQPQESVEGVVDETFSEVDLGKAIAEMMTSGDTSVQLCVMIACAARTGKTTLLTTTIAWLHKLTEGNARIRIWNGKEKRNAATGELEDKFLGLVDDPTRYYAIKTPAEGKHFAEQYHQGTLEMGEPRRYPDVDITDELNNIRAVVEAYDMQNGLTKNNAKLTQVDSNSSLRVTQGTSRGKFTLITSHSSYVTEVGINRSLQDSIYTIVLGRGGALDPIYKSLKGSLAVVKNTIRANQLLKELQNWETSPTRDHSKVVALTNLIDGTYKLYFVKYVDLSKVSFAPINEQPQAVEDDPYAMWDEQFEDEVGHQPEEDPSWKLSKAEQERVNRENEQSRQQLIETLSTWIKQLGKLPSDAELSAKLQELLGVVPSDNVIQGVKTLLNQHGHNFDR